MQPPMLVIHRGENSPMSVPQARQSAKLLGFIGRLRGAGGRASWSASRLGGPRSTAKASRSRMSSDQSSYLGTIFAANAKQCYDIKARIAQAFARCGKLRHVFDAQNLSIRTKLRLHKAAVCSILSYGCETWRFTPRVMCQSNGANSRMLARFTGKTIP